MKRLLGSLQRTADAMTQNIKRRMLDDLGYGLMQEATGIVSMMGKESEALSRGLCALSGDRLQILCDHKR